MRRAGIVFGVVAAFGLLMASPGLAQQNYPPPGEPECVLSTNTATGGQTVGVSGSNWMPKSNVLIQFFSKPVTLGTAHTNKDGSFSTTVQIPSNASSGSHKITATGQNLNGQATTVTCGVVVVVRVARPAPPAAPSGGGGNVAFTGTNVSLGLVILGVLVIAGLGFVAAGRRKKAHAE